MKDDARRRWEAVYAAKRETELSWRQESPAQSLELVAMTGAAPAPRIIDVGAGASRVVDGLVERGCRDTAVLDLSQTATPGSAGSRPMS